MFNMLIMFNYVKWNDMLKLIVQHGDKGVYLQYKSCQIYQ